MPQWTREPSHATQAQPIIMSTMRIHTSKAVINHLLSIHTHARLTSQTLHTTKGTRTSPHNQRTTRTQSLAQVNSDPSQSLLAERTIDIEPDFDRLLSRHRDIATRRGNN